MNIYDTLILLVDNNLKFLDKIKKLLLKNGFKNIKIANSCNKALEICSTTNKSFLIIMEYIFETMSGDDLINKIKEQCNMAKFIVLSKSDKLADSVKSIKAGVLSFVYKDDEWERIILDSVVNWLEYYINKEHRRLVFKTTINNIAVV